MLTVRGGLHVRQRIFRGGQGFAAFGQKFEGPPLWMFLTPSRLLDADRYFQIFSSYAKQCNVAEIEVVKHINGRIHLTL